MIMKLLCFGFFSVFGELVCLVGECLLMLNDVDDKCFSSYRLAG
jgi:hypothetical protein